jgi:ribose transport system substrate-binding protein
MAQSQPSPYVTAGQPAGWRKSGLMTGAITQDPDDIGYQTVKAAVAVINGKEVPGVIHTNYYWYDRSNLDEPQIESALYK